MSKRANGQGSVYKRGSYWVAQVTVGYNGKGQPRYKRKGGFRTKTEALTALPVIKNEVTAKPVPTIAYYYKAFCKGKGSQISEDKQTAYRIAYNRLAPIHNTPINELSVVQLQALVNDTCRTYYPARDVRVLLNHLFRLAAVDGVANQALPGLLQLPRLHETPREAFTEDEQIALWLSYEAGNTDAALPLIMIYTGMMTGEMMRLKRSMVHMDTQEIIGAGLKTETRRNAAILIPDGAVDLINGVIERAEGEYLFPTRDAEFYAMYYRALTAANVTRRSPYCCRHTTATSLAVIGRVAPQVVQRIMRWSSTKMMDRYVHITDQDARDALNRL